MNAPQEKTSSPPTNVTLAVLTVEMKHVKDGIDRIEKHLSNSVSTEAWERRNTYVDEKLTTLNTEIREVESKAASAASEIWSEIKSKRVPWTSVAAFMVAGLLALFEVIERIGQ